MDAVLQLVVLPKCALRHIFCNKKLLFFLSCETLHCIDRWFSTGVPRAFAKCAAMLLVEELYKIKYAN
jgi:hypothetical protein